MWWVVAGLWLLAGGTYVVLRWIEEGKQVDRMINWTLPPPEKEEEGQL